MTPRRASELLAAAAALALLAPTTASASGAQGLSVAPARVEARVQPGALLPPVTLRNDTSRRMAVTASVLQAGQDLEGLPVWKMDAATLSDGRRIGKASPSRFVLAPGSARRVRVRVLGERPLRGRGSYGVLVFSSTEAVPDRAAGALLASRVRLAANLLLRYPGPGAPAGGATALRAEQAGPRALRFLVRVRNAGRLHGVPAARLRIRDAAGRIAWRGRFARGAVLPGAERELRATPAATLPAGTYTARASVRLGGRTTTQVHRFTLTGPNRLPTPDLRLDALPAPRAVAGEPVDVRVGLRNAGSAPARVAGTVALDREERALGGAPLPAGARRTATVRLPAVAEGEHELRVVLRDGDRVLAERTVVLRAGAQAAAWDRLRDWAARHVGLLLVAFPVALLLVAAGAARMATRRARTATPA